MQMTFVKYRTKREVELSGSDKWWSEYAVVPSIWLPDLLDWLSDIEAEVLETTDNYDHEPRLPINWPALSDCQYCILVSDALHCVL